MPRKPFACYLAQSGSVRASDAVMMMVVMVMVILVVVVMAERGLGSSPWGWHSWPHACLDIYLHEF